MHRLGEDLVDFISKLAVLPASLLVWLLRGAHQPSAPPSEERQSHHLDDGEGADLRAWDDHPPFKHPFAGNVVQCYSASVVDDHERWFVEADPPIDIHSTVTTEAFDGMVSVFDWDREISSHQPDFIATFIS